MTAGTPRPPPACLPAHSPTAVWRTADIDPSQVWNAILDFYGRRKLGAWICIRWNWVSPGIGFKIHKPKYCIPRKIMWKKSCDKPSYQRATTQLFDYLADESLACKWNNAHKHPEWRFILAVCMPVSCVYTRLKIGLACLNSGSSINHTQQAMPIIAFSLSLSYTKPIINYIQNVSVLIFRFYSSSSDEK